jgi:hypothetical protein
MAYRVSGEPLWRRAVVFIDKILKGVRPGDLPKALGITMPPSLLVLADEMLQ